MLLNYKSNWLRILKSQLLIAFHRFLFPQSVKNRPIVKGSRTQEELLLQEQIRSEIISKVHRQLALKVPEIRCQSLSKYRVWVQKRRPKMELENFWRTTDAV